DGAEDGILAPRGQYGHRGVPFEVVTVPLVDLRLIEGVLRSADREDLGPRIRRDLRGGRRCLVRLGMREGKETDRGQEDRGANREQTKSDVPPHDCLSTP